MIARFSPTDSRDAAVVNLPYVLKKTLNPHAESFWQTPPPASDPKGWQEYREWRSAVNDGVEAALSFAVQFDFDESSLLWVRRYIHGRVARDATIVQIARDLADRIYLRVTGRTPPITGVYCEPQAAGDVATTDQIVNKTSDVVPAKSLTRSVTLREAAHLHSGQKKANPSDYIARKVKAGVLTKPIGNGQSWRFILDEFPESARDKLR